MSKTPKTIRVAPETEQELIKLHGNTSNGGTEAAEAYISIRKYTISELKGIFSREELIGLIASLNGTIFEPTFAANNRMFAIHCEDAEIYEKCFSTNNANQLVIMAKILSLTSAQTYFLQQEISMWWNDDKRDMDAFIAKFV